MSQLNNLSAEDHAKVNAKLADLQHKTGQSWGFDVTTTPGCDQGAYLLEIRVNGQVSRPVVLDGEDHKPGDRICNELDRAYEKTT
jgi:hypothetical protein